ncbi:MAG: hypothetical protein LQ351_005544 [Letrouitia transgressa]|nr:MAG: hypothetical protein LQ351_005544 [Letrouitia transgressa]
MTSISSSVIPPQATSNASQTVAQAQSSSPSLSGRTPPLSSGPSPAPARSYASATKKQSSPTSATNTSIPPGAVGGSNLPHHGKADSISPLNGKGPITPAVPALGPPTIVNGNTAASITSTPIEHGRKASVTIDKAGASGYLPNGGPVGAFGFARRESNPESTNHFTRDISFSNPATRGQRRQTTFCFAGSR